LVAVVLVAVVLVAVVLVAVVLVAVVLVAVFLVLVFVVLVLIFFELVLDARRVALPEVSSPEGEETADDEAQDTEVNWEVDCGDDSVLVTSSRDVLTRGARGCSLIELPPGGEMRSEADSQPLGRPVEVEGRSVATQGQTFGVTKVEVSLCVPLQGIGMSEAVAVILGAAWVSVGSSARLPLILPPLETIDSHEPDLSP